MKRVTLCLVRTHCKVQVHTKRKGQSIGFLQKTRSDCSIIKGYIYGFYSGVWTPCAWILQHYHHCKGEITYCQASVPDSIEMLLNRHWLTKWAVRLSTKNVRQCEMKKDTENWSDAPVSANMWSRVHVHQLSKRLSLTAKLEIKLQKRFTLKEVPKSYLKSRISYRHESELFWLNHLATP